MAFGQRSPARITALRGAQWGQILGTRVDPVLGEVALHDQNLAATTQSAAAAHRIHVNAERASRLQQRRPQRKSSALAGGSEDYQCILIGHGLNFMSASRILR